MRVRAEARAGRERERGHRAPPAPSAIEALQRSAGNAAVSRMLVQRKLWFTDVKQPFEDPSAAAAFLQEEYTKVYKQAPAGDAAKRLAELAGAAAHADWIVTDVPAALGYIQNGTAMQASWHSADPSKSPRRDDLEWGYQFTSDRPGQVDVPQSPQWQFPETAYPGQTTDIGSQLDQYGTLLQQDRKQYTGLGQNILRYGIEVKYRIEQLDRIEGPGGQALYGPRRGGRPDYGSHKVRSQLYSSTFGKPGAKADDEFIDFQQQMRAELAYLHGHSQGLKPFYPASSMYAYERETEEEAEKARLWQEKEDERLAEGRKPRKPRKPKENTKQDRSGDYFRNASSQAISSLYVHSEVQAAADAHQGVGASLAKQALQELMVAARAAKVPDHRLRIVVLDLSWTGYSDPNSVCGGACKGALVHILQVLEEHFDAGRASAKIDLAREGIDLRATQNYAISGHVASHKEFGGMGVGATPAPSYRERPRGRHMTEYKPY